MFVILMRPILETSIVILIACLALPARTFECASIPHCLQCSQDGQCTLCTSPMLVSSNKCIIPAQNINTSANSPALEPPQNTQYYSIPDDNIQSAPASTPVIKFSSAGYEGRSACILSWKGVCIICGHGFEMADGGDCILRFQQCLSYSRQWMCLSCHSSLQLADGQCIDRGCEASNAYQCSRCRKQYRLNMYRHCQNIGCSKTVDGKCTLCESGYSLQNGTCIIKQNVSAPAANNNASNTSIANQTPLVNPTPQPAPSVQTQPIVPVQPVFNDEHCTKVNINRCLKCEEGYYVGQDGHCKGLPDNCLEETCIYCKTGFISINSKCVPLTNCVKIQGNICIMCQTNYSVTVMGTCIKTVDFCLQYSLSGCARCPANYILVDGRTCQLNASYSDPNCNIKDYKGQCVMCKEKYRLQPKYSNLCMSTNTQCKTASKTGECLGCYEGYRLNTVSGQCIQVKTIQNCAEQVEGECRKCASRYYLVNGYTCKEVDPLCKDYDGAMGYCLSCYSGYVLIGNTCEVLMNMANQLSTSTITLHAPSNASVSSTSATSTNNSNSGSSSLQNCRTSKAGNASVCESCYDGYYLDDGKCTRVNALCKSYDSTNGHCLSCFQGYSLAGPLCTPLTQAPTHCKNTDQATGACLQCIDRYYRVGHDCAQVSPLCNEYDQTSGKCTSCYPGYILLKGECMVEGANTGNVQNCQEYVQGSMDKCVKCMLRYYMKEDKCQAVSQLCGTYDQATGQCITCIQGYVKVGKGVCVMPALGADELCTSYDENGFCQTCAQGHQLTNFMCV